MNRRTFEKAVKRVGTIIDNFAEMLSDRLLHIKSSPGIITMISTDSKSQSWVKVDVEYDGLDIDMAVPYGFLRRISKTVRTDEIEMRQVKDVLEIKCGEFVAQKKESTVKKDWPQIYDHDTKDDIAALTCRWSDLRAQIPFILVAINRAMPKNFTSYILFKTTREDDFILVGTDGHRLHCATVDCKYPLDKIEPVDFKLSWKFFKALQAMQLSPDAEIELMFTDTYLYWSVPTERTEGSVYLQDTPYPDYEKVIVSQIVRPYEIPVDAVSEFIRIAGDICGRNTSSKMAAENIMELYFHKTSMDISYLARHSEDLFLTTSLNMECPDDFRHYFNLDYLKDCIQYAKGDTVTVSWGELSSINPMRVDYGSRKLCILMPVRCPDTRNVGLI